MSPNPPEDAHAWLECELDRIVEGFGPYGLAVAESQAFPIPADLHR